MTSTGALLCLFVLILSLCSHCVPLCNCFASQLGIFFHLFVVSLHLFFVDLLLFVIVLHLVI